jgi:nitrogen fixation/metabolism regulation signal transduction histidine kinase
MQRFIPKSFFGQLILGTILVQTLFLGLFIWYTVVSQRQGAEVRARSRIVQQLDRLAAACSEELDDDDMRSVQSALELSRLATTIEVARLTDLSGKTLAVTKNGQGHGLDSYELAVLPTATRRQIFEIKNGQMEAVTPVMRQGKPYALLWLEPNRGPSQTTIDTIVGIALSYGGFALLANIIPIFLIVGTITRPLHTLRTATDRVMRDPDLSAGFPLPVTTTNEAGELTVSFNAMVNELGVQRRGLLETLALLDSMLSNAPIGFAFFDPELRYVRVNEFLARLHELSIEEHLGRRPTEVYPAQVAEAKLDCLRKVFETGTAVRNVELSGEMPHGPGVQRSWLMHFYPVRTAQEAIRWVGVIVIETTDQLKAEEALRKTEKLAAAGRLAASIAHEINNPLEAVTNLLYLLATHESLDESAAEFVRTAQEELARVSQITQQTLRFYRQSTLPSRVNIADILNSIVALYQSRITSASVTVVRRFRGEPEVFGFGGELRQLFANLVGNALDAMPNGGSLRLCVHSGHGRRMDGTWSKGVRITVADTGTGMSEETLRRIFEAFFTTKEVTGTGLGLWVSEEIVRKHLGTVRVKSRQGEKSGTSFMIFLPDGEG